MNGLRPVMLVAGREIRERVASRSFQVSSAMTIIFVLAALFLPALISDDSAPSYTLGATPDAPDDLTSLVAAMAPDPGTEIDVEPYADRAALEEAVREGDVEVGVSGPTTVIQGPDTGPQVLTLVSGALQNSFMEQRALDMGITQEQLAQMFVGGVEVVELEESDADDRTGLAFIGTMLLFISIVTYGQWVLIGVVEEKTSRVVEVILGALSPRHLLAGKVVGIGALGLAQLLIIAAVAVFAAQGYSDLDLPPIGFGIAAIVIGWFVLGFTFYAAAYAVTGSMVSRQEDAQNASFPLTMVMVIAYFVAASVLGGDNTVARVLSIVPPFSPLAMPIRQASGIAAPWEVVVAVALMLATTVGMLRIGGGMYATGLLRSGGRTKWRDALKGARS